eukprot:2661534-Prymnesium_polylepis.1
MRLGERVIVWCGRGAGRGACVCWPWPPRGGEGEVLGGTVRTPRRNGAVRSGAPPHAAPGDEVPRGRHGVGTEHTRGVEAA